MPPLIDGLSFGALIADKAFDSNNILADLNERGAKIVISQHPRRTKPIPLDAATLRFATATAIILTLNRPGIAGGSNS